MGINSCRFWILYAFNEFYSFDTYLGINSLVLVGHVFISIILPVVTLLYSHSLDWFQFLCHLCIKHTTFDSQYILYGRATASNPHPLGLIQFLCLDKYTIRQCILWLLACVLYGGFFELGWIVFVNMYCFPSHIIFCSLTGIKVRLVGLQVLQNTRV